ncbi:hypothetical protein HK104_006563 [Borealophlyctis nickersoniae]|nr:hypothetical protein HK104_006563 [Borealophlyctis nickersoniae]
MPPSQPHRPPQSLMSSIPSYQKKLAGFYVGTVLFGSLIQALVNLPMTVFNDKRNPLNVYFVKSGWGWTSVPLLLFAPMAAYHASLGKPSPRRQSAVINSLLRFTASTLYWVIFTQWFFGPSILDRVYIGTGSLLIHASLTIYEELRVISSTARGAPPAIPNGPSTPSKNPRSSQPTTTNGEIGPYYQVAEALLSSFLIFILLLWWVMLCATSLYFHSWKEKTVGTLIGLAMWVVMYVIGLPRIAPHAMPAGPGIVKLNTDAYVD